ncbi:MAG: AAA family ATPase, partial [Deltaproteobacteria bacterium]|nr:AAA family ATPase [Deltaproteobacteria bacterium]
MKYYSVLNLNREPFSNSPDPEFFYHSREHVDCLQKLELSLLLRRGLNVIIGEVGTGKTTLCRQIIRRFSKREEVDTHLILDPHFVDANEFLITVAKMFTGKKPPKSSNNWQVKEYIKQYLYRSGVDQNKTTILIIDEGQKIPVFCLEILREFLNYETNEYKLLQIVIFAQVEFEKTVQKLPNFADRINLYHYLKPLNFRDTCKMIKFRLEQSRGSGKRLELFSLPALAAVYRVTDGYPRKIINLCHQTILTMIIQNQKSIGYFLVRSCANRVFHNQGISWKRIGAAVAVSACVLAIIGVLLTSSSLKAYLPWEDKFAKPVAMTPEASVATETEEEQTPAAAPKLAAQANMLTQSNISTTSEVSTGSEPVAQLQPEAQPKISAQSSKQTSDVEQVPRATEAKLQPEAHTKAAEKIAPVQTNPPEEIMVAEIQKNISQPPVTVSNAYSDLLGKLTLQRNETLSRIIQIVYGNYNSRYFRSLILANPLIDDPDRVEVGQTISLPAIPAKVRPQRQPTWWVQVDEKDSLEAAFNFLRSYPDQAPPVRMIPYWTSEAGTRFMLVLKGIFSSKTA